MEEEIKPQRPKWRRIVLIVICVILALLLSVMIFLTAYVHHLLSLVTYDENSILHATLSPEELEALRSDPDYDPNFTGPNVAPEDVPANTIPSTPQEELASESIINIMLIGQDRRPGQTRQRSDSMILCSFNTKNNTLTMISFLRDTYIAEIPGIAGNPNYQWANKSDKLNAAFAFGGTKMLNETLALYFGVHVDANIVVDFEGFKGIIDMLGGVDISLTKAEVNHLNTTKYWNLVVGNNHLNGEEALAYSRIRKIDRDAMRAQRQRNVLAALINAYMNKSTGEMLILAKDILASGFIQTDMSAEEVLDYTSRLFPKLATATINNLQIPADGTYTSMTVGNVTATKVCDFEANRKLLEQVLQ